MAKRLGEVAVFCGIRGVGRLRHGGRSIGRPRLAWAPWALIPTCNSYGLCSTLQRKAAKSARRSQHCSETTLQRRPSKSARPEGVRRKFQWTLFRFPFGPVLRIFSRQSRALCTLSVCTTCSLITFPQAVCSKREPLLTQERLPRRGTRTRPRSGLEGGAAVRAGASTPCHLGGCARGPVFQL